MDNGTSKFAKLGPVIFSALYNSSIAHPPKALPKKYTHQEYSAKVATFVNVKPGTICQTASQCIALVANLTIPFIVHLQPTQKKVQQKKRYVPNQDAAPFSGGPTSPKARGITKSNTMSNATGRVAVGGSAANRRSAIGCEQKSSSSDKTNVVGMDSVNARYVVLSRVCARAPTRPPRRLVKDSSRSHCRVVYIFRFALSLSLSCPIESAMCVALLYTISCVLLGVGVKGPRLGQETLLLTCET